MQTMQVDARFQFPAEQAPIDDNVAEAVIRFGDALARGDADALREKMDAGTKGVLDQLVNSEAWYDATQDIEAVRVVYLGNVTTSGVEQPRFDLDSAVDRAVEIENEIAAKIGDEQAAQIMADPSAAFDIMNDPVVVELSREGEELIQAAYAAGELREFIHGTTEARGLPFTADMVDNMVDRLEEAFAIMERMGTASIDIAFAVQAPNESYVLGWSMTEAYGGLVFGMAPTTTEVRRFATDWDGASAWSLRPSFAMMQGTGNITPVSNSNSPDDDYDAGDAPESEGPTRKSTPRGPITIPGG